MLLTLVTFIYCSHLSADPVFAPKQSIDLRECLELLLSCRSSLSTVNSDQTRLRDLFFATAFANRVAFALERQETLQQKPTMSQNSFFGNPDFLTDEMKKIVKKSLTYFRDLGFFDSHLNEIFCQNAKDILDNPVKYDVSVGSGDCHERATLLMKWVSLYRETISLQKFEEIPKPVKSILALCWLLQEFGQSREGKDSFEGCSVPETRSSVEEKEIGRFPVKTTTCQKKLAHSALDFFARTRAMIGIATKVELYGNLNLPTFCWSYIPVSGVSIPVLDHYISLKKIFEEMKRERWAHALMLTHFASGESVIREKFLLSCDTGNSSSFGTAEKPTVTITATPTGCTTTNSLLCFELYTVNLTEEQKQTVATELHKDGNLEMFFLSLGKIISGMETKAQAPGSIPFIGEKLEKTMIKRMLGAGQQGIGGRHIWVDTVTNFFNKHS